MLHVFYSFSGRELATVSAKDFDHTRALKKHLCELCGFPVYLQSILHNGKILDDYEKLEATMDLQLVVLSIYGLSHRSCTANFAMADLAQAARRNREDMVRVLLQAGVDINCRHNSMTALTIAVVSGSLRVVRLLLEGGAAEDTADDSGRTPLMLAAERGHFEVARSLLEGGANKDLTDHEGKTALMLASLAGHSTIASLLLEGGAAKDVADRSGRNCLDAGS